ncbi:unnamed protein product, partial [Ectocarpus sp. 13 AM-2016]
MVRPRNDRFIRESESVLYACRAAGSIGFMLIMLRSLRLKTHVENRGRLLLSTAVKGRWPSGSSLSQSSAAGIIVFAPNTIDIFQTQFPSPASDFGEILAVYFPVAV